jgi:hypothetical protein
MAANSLSRALFLTFAFPRIIAAGRAWFVPARGVDVDIEGRHDATTSPAREASDGTLTPNTPAPAKDSQAAPGLPTDASAFEGVASVNGAAEEPPIIPAAVDKAHGSGFDLAFLRWSYVFPLIPFYPAPPTSLLVPFPFFLSIPSWIPHDTFLIFPSSPSSYPPARWLIAHTPMRTSPEWSPTQH